MRSRKQRNKKRQPGQAQEAARAPSWPAANGPALVPLGDERLDEQVRQQLAGRWQRVAGNRATIGVIRRQQAAPESSAASWQELLPEELHGFARKLLAYTKSDVQSWRGYKETFPTHIPGRQSGRAAAVFQQQAMAPFRSNPAGWQAAQEALKAALGESVVAEMRDMVAFGLYALRDAEARSDLHTLARVFGLNVKATRDNKYTCVVTFATGVDVARVVGGGVTIRHLVVKYRNESLGLAYAKELKALTGKGIAGLSTKKGKGKKLLDELKDNVTLKQPQVVEATMHPGYLPAFFWGPGRFEGPLVEAKIGAEAAAESDLIDAKVFDFTMLEMLVFFDENMDPFPFHAPAGLKGPSIGGYSVTKKWRELFGKDFWKKIAEKKGKEGKKGIDLEGKLGLEIGGGYAWAPDEAEAEESWPKQVRKPVERPDPQVETIDMIPVGKDHTRFWHVYFDTGKDSPDADAREQIAAAAAYIRRLTATYETDAVQVIVTGHASPRWRSAQSGAIAADRNQALSEARAATTEGALRRALGGAGGELVFDVFGVPGPPLYVNEQEAQTYSGGQGSLEALAEGQDPADNQQKYRRADIYVYIRSGFAR